MTRLTTALLATFLTATAAFTQTTKIAPPLSPVIVSYQYWPSQYIQFVTGPELPLSMFEFDVDSSAKQPLYHAVLTGKKGERTNYSNTDALVARYKAMGEPSFKSTFAVDSDESEKVGATMTVRFTTQDEKPVEWRFVQGSEISEQGSGLQPVPQAPIPVFAYREQGAVAGEGTALKIGDAVSQAEVWTEISKPPYFVGYRGAVTSSAHMIILPKTSHDLTVSKYPAALTAGSAWEMETPTGDHQVLTIDKVAGTQYTLSATSRYSVGVRTVMDATRTADAWTVDRVQYMPATKGGEKHAASLTFAGGNMDIGIGKKARIASATATTTGDAADRTTEVKMTAPAWVAGKSLAEEAKVSGDAITTSAK